MKVDAVPQISPVYGISDPEKASRAGPGPGFWGQTREPRRIPNDT